ncbi:hypothetical protein [Accumulibacter sp.]|nr:hypothetical protein [Accumulibacter sp.]
MRRALVLVLLALLLAVTVTTFVGSDALSYALSCAQAETPPDTD